MTPETPLEGKSRRGLAEDFSDKVSAVDVLSADLVRRCSHVKELASGT
jgi:hypothetical protein